MKLTDNDVSSDEDETRSPSSIDDNDDPPTDDDEGDPTTVDIHTDHVHTKPPTDKENGLQKIQPGRLDRKKQKLKVCINKVLWSCIQILYPFGNRAFLRISKYRGGVGKIERKTMNPVHNYTRQ